MDTIKRATVHMVLLYFRNQMPRLLFISSRDFLWPLYRGRRRIAEIRYLCISFNFTTFTVISQSVLVKHKGGGRERECDVVIQLKPEQPTHKI